MAMDDALTGLGNRRQLDAVLTQQLALSERTGQPVSCLMADVDHFKQFNDRFGHEAGDAVLREVGKVLRAGLRPGDQAYRYGGEEFLILLPGLDGDEARSRAEEIRQLISSLQISHEGIALGPVHASVGVASTPAHSSRDRLVQTADAALLRAKKEGRDRVVVASARKDRRAA
jgi:diguanylate cyclase (GGDEF)-like protein